MKKPPSPGFLKLVNNTNLKQVLFPLDHHPAIIKINVFSSSVSGKTGISGLKDIPGLIRDIQERINRRR